MKDFKDKVAVITGAADGIGKAVALAAAGLGMRLVLADIDVGGVTATAERIQGLGGRTAWARVDVADPAAVAGLADLAYAEFGAVHLLVNNAGVALAKTAWETTPKDWEWVMGVNLYGVTNGIRSFIPRMLAGGEEGHVVNVASMAGLVSEPGLAAYNASKFAVVTVTEGLHHDLSLRGARIRASVLCPGWVRTRIAEAERNRDADERSDFRALDAQAQRVGWAMRKAVDNGMDPAMVAETLFDAVAKDRFYILTHSNGRDAVRVRAADILDERAPSLLPL